MAVVAEKTAAAIVERQREGLSSVVAEKSAAAIAERQRDGLSSVVAEKSAAAIAAWQWERREAATVGQNLGFPPESSIRWVWIDLARREPGREGVHSATFCGFSAFAVAGRSRRRR